MNLFKNYKKGKQKMNVLQIKLIRQKNNLMMAKVISQHNKNNLKFIWIQKNCFILYLIFKQILKIFKINAKKIVNIKKIEKLTFLNKCLYITYIIINYLKI